MSIIYKPQIAGLDAISVISLGTANGLSLSSDQVLSLQLASGSQNGALSSTDWTTFNNKVSSVGLSDGSSTPIYDISGSPVTSSGTLTFSLKNQNANAVFAGPSSGGAGVPTFRALVSSDLPTVPVSILSTDTNSYMLTMVSGTPTWISGTGLGTSPGTSQVWVNTPNGHGSTNTAIRTFSNTVVNVGSDITYTSSATNGDSFTINTTGLYSITYSDGASTQGNFYGLSRNSNQLTTSIDSINSAHFILDTANPTAVDSYSIPLSITIQLASGDVIRAHTDANNNMNSTDKRAFFNITRVG